MLTTVLDVFLANISMLVRENGNKIIPEEIAVDNAYFEDILSRKPDNTMCMFDVNNMRTTMMANIVEQTDLVQTSTSLLVLHTAMARVNSAITVGHCLGHLENEHAYNLRPTHRYPANKKLEVQPWFLKTKRPIKRQVQSLSLPTDAVRKKIKVELNRRYHRDVLFALKKMTLAVVLMLIGWNAPIVDYGPTGNVMVEGSLFQNLSITSKVDIKNDIISSIK